MTKNAHLSFSVLCPPLAVLCCAVLALPAFLPPVLPLSLLLAWLSLSQSQFYHPLAQNERDCSSLLSCFAHKSSQASDHFLCLFLPPPPLLPTLFYFIALHFISFHFWGNTAKLEHNIHGEGISLNDITALCYFQHYSQSHAFRTIWFSFLLQLPLWMWQIYSWKRPHLDSEWKNLRLSKRLLQAAVLQAQRCSSARKLFTLIFRGNIGRMAV